MRITKKYEHLVHLAVVDASVLSSKENKNESVLANKSNNNSQGNLNNIPATLVAVEVKPQLLESKLPPSVRQKKFGAM